MVGLPQEVVVKLGLVEAEDLELMGEQQLGDGQADARRAAGHDGYFAEAQGVDGGGGDPDSVGLGGVEHFVGGFG